MNNIMSDQCDSNALMITFGVYMYTTVRNQTANVNMFFEKERSQGSGTYYEL